MELRAQSCLVLRACQNLYFLLCRSWSVFVTCILFCSIYILLLLLSLFVVERSAEKVEDKAVEENWRSIKYFWSLQQIDRQESWISKTYFFVSHWSFVRPPILCFIVKLILKQWSDIFGRSVGSLGSVFMKYVCQKMLP